MKLKLIPAKTGIRWVKEGIAVFRKQPMRMTALLVVFMLLASVLSAIPVIGAALSLATMPFLTVVLMAAAAQVQQGRQPQIGMVIGVFKAESNAVRFALAKLGACYAVFLLLLMGVSVAIDGGTFLRVYSGQETPTPELVMSGSFQAAFWLVMLLGMAGSTLMWFAPGLVYWFKVSALQAMLYSAVACMRNFGALALYMLAWGGVVVLVAMAVMVVIQVLLAIGVPAGLAVGLYLFSILMVSAALLGSAAFAVRDNFEAPEAFKAPPP